MFGLFWARKWTRIFFGMNPSRMWRGLWRALWPIQLGPIILKRHREEVG